MNQKTAKLLKKWATTDGTKPREVRRWWLALNRQQRTAEGRRFRTGLEEKT